MLIEFLGDAGLADSSQPELLRKAGLSGWNAHLERAPGDITAFFFDGKSLKNPPQTKINLLGADLSGMDLSGVDFDLLPDFPPVIG